MLSESIYTVEEVAQHLQVPIEAIESEIKAGHLKALYIGELKRIQESELNTYKKQALSPAENNTVKTGPINLHSAVKFTYKWPTTDEEYTDVQEGIVRHNGRDHHVKVGFTNRKTAGKQRRRSLVLVDKYPTVEFVSSDTDKNGKMVSIIKDRRRKQLPAGADPPPDYAGMPVGSYRDIVDGPYARNGLAVICGSSELETMVRHALIRHTYRRAWVKEAQSSGANS